MTPEKRQEVRELYKTLRSKRKVAKKLGLNVKTVRAALGSPPPKAPEGSLLAPFLAIVLNRAMEGLSATRIFRELRELGYTGGRTLVARTVRPLRKATSPRKKAFRRFETPPAEEAQVDWSPIRVMLAGKEVLLHCFALVLAYSRKLWACFFRDERMPTLFSAHLAAFEALGGVTKRIVYDNMATVVLGRIERKPLWNPRFLEFSKHFAFEPFVCRPRDPNRKGRVESAFHYIQQDAILGNAFESLDHLNRHLQLWIQRVADVRVHGTTRETPRDAWLRERPLLTPLPPVAFATWRTEVRKVQSDCLISVDGNLYSVPPRQVGREVQVRVHPDRLEVVDPPSPAAAGYGGQARGVYPPKPSEAAPQRREGGAGLKRRMKGFAVMHVAVVQRLVGPYGVERVAAAIDEATGLRNWDACSVRRTLALRHPEVMDAQELPLAGPAADAARQAGSTEERSLGDILPGGAHEEA